MLNRRTVVSGASWWSLGRAALAAGWSVRGDEWRVADLVEQCGPGLTRMGFVQYKCGEILRVIAYYLGVSRRRLADRLRARGVRLRGEKPSLESVLEMRRRYEQGESLARVGEELGFNPSTVRVHLLRAGLAIRDPHGRDR